MLWCEGPDFQIMLPLLCENIVQSRTSLSCPFLQRFEALQTVLGIDQLVSSIHDLPFCIPASTLFSHPYAIRELSCRISPDRLLELALALYQRKTWHSTVQ